MLAVTAFVVFFSSEKVQTQLANSITQKVNDNFDTAIEVGKAKINLQGKIQFDDVLIRDHRKDTLLLISQIKLDLTELENVLRGAYDFSSLHIISPELHLTTYQNEDLSNLKQFVNKLKRDSTKQPPSTSIAHLLVEDGILILSNRQAGKTERFSSIEFALTNVLLEEKEFSTSMDSMSLFLEDYDESVDLSGDINFTPSKIQWTSLNLNSSPFKLAGSLSLKYTELTSEALRNSASIDLAIDHAEMNTHLLPLSQGVKIPPTKIGLEGKVKGSFADLMAELQLSLPGKSKLKGFFQFSQNPEGFVQVNTKNLVSSITKQDFRQLIAAYLPPENQLLHMSWDKMQIHSKVDYIHKNTLHASAEIKLNEGLLLTELALKRKTNDWTFSQQIDFSNLNSSDFIQKDFIKQLNGKGTVQGRIVENSIEEFSFDFNLSDFLWKNKSFKNTKLVGSKLPSGLLIDGRLDDEKVKMNFSFEQGNETTHDFTFLSQVEELNLSLFGWTSEQSNVRLKTNVLLKGKMRNLEHIDVSEFEITNNKNEYQFDDFSFNVQKSKNKNRIAMNSSDVMDFSFHGDFLYSNIPLLIESAIKEAFLIPYKPSLQKVEFFAFDFVLKDKLLKALYPNVISPEDIRLNGMIHSQLGQSFFEFDLPFIQFNGYNFESISLKFMGDNPVLLSRFSAKKVYGNSFYFSKINLDTKNIDNALSGSLSALYGPSDKDSLSIDFLYSQANDHSLFEIIQTQFQLGGENWRLASKKKPVLSFDYLTNEISLPSIGFESENQRVDASISYRSKQNYSVQLLANNFDLDKALPEGEKFNFGGKLSTNINLVNSPSLKTASIDMAVRNLAINEKEMGDFELTMTGNPQFNSYQMTTSLVKNQLTMLNGSGTIFVPEDQPNLNLDFDLTSFDVSFLSSLGKDKITNSKGNLTGKLNLWGSTSDLKLSGNAILNDSGMSIPSINTRYALAQGTEIVFRDRTLDFNNALLEETATKTTAQLNGQLSHINFNGWEMNIQLLTDRLMVYNRSEDPNALFYGKGYLAGEANFTGPTKSLTLEVIGSSSEGTTLVIPWKESKGLTDTSFIDFLPKGVNEKEQISTEISSFDEAFRGFEMIFDLDINRNAEVEIVVDQSSGSTLSGRGSGNILIETNIDGKFNIWGDFITYEGVYNFKNLGLIDKKFSVKQGGTIVWEGDPLEAQLNIEAVYQVPGGANPALLVDNPNFNRKIPTDVSIQLIGNLIKPDDPVFDISFPNTTGILVSEINYRLADQQRRQLQAISLLSQGIFISDVSVSLQGITNNLYEKASDVFSTLIGSNDGKLNVGLNYLQGEETPAFDLRTEDRIGLTLSTQISDRILINGKIGVPIDGLQETVIVGDVQIDFILNDSGTLKAKVFNRENEFRYLGDEFGYTQGMGMSYQVDFNTFQELIEKVKSNAIKENANGNDQFQSNAVEFYNKDN